MICRALTGEDQGIIAKLPSVHTFTHYSIGGPDLLQAYGQHVTAIGGDHFPETACPYSRFSPHRAPIVVPWKHENDSATIAAPDWSYQVTS